MMLVRVPVATCLLAVMLVPIIMAGQAAPPPAAGRVFRVTNSADDASAGHVPMGVEPATQRLSAKPLRSKSWPGIA